MPKDVKSQAKPGLHRPKEKKERQGKRAPPGRGSTTRRPKRSCREVNTAELGSDSIDPPTDSLDHAPPADLRDLPLIALQRIFTQFGVEDLAHAPQVCKAWREAMRDDSVWQECYLHRGWQVDASRRVDASGSWRERFKRESALVCYDCGELCERRLGVGLLKVRLCQACSQAYANPHADQRLVTPSDASKRYCLPQSSFAGLDYGVDTNPINPAFAPMRLYRRPDVVRLAIRRWGNMQNVERERRRRLLR